MVALGLISAKQYNSNETMYRAIKQLPNYCATYPDSRIRYKQSNMVLRIHSDGSYLSEYQVRSQCGGHFFRGEKFNQSDNNGATLTLT